MRYRYLKKSDIYKYMLTFLIFLVVISSASVWVQVDVELIPHTILQYFIWLLAIILILFKTKNIKFSNYYYLVLIVVCLIGYSLFNSSYILGALLNVFIPLTFFYVLGKVNGKKGPFLICECFVNVMCFLAVVSLFFFATASILQIIMPTGYLTYQWSWISRVPSYFHLYYEPVPGRISQFGIPKNCGIFPEAPMFNFPLCVALGMSKLILNNKSRFKNIVLLVTIITTGATSGYFFAIGVYGYLIIKKYGFRNVITKSLIGGVVVYFGYQGISKIFESKTQTASYSIRYDHLYACISTIMNTRFMGSGVGNLSLLESYMSYRQGASVGFLYLLALGGIFCTLLLLLPLINSAIQAIKAGNYNVLCYTLLFFMLVFLTQVVFRNNMWFVVGTVFMNIKPLLLPNAHEEEHKVRLKRIRHRSN